MRHAAAPLGPTAPPGPPWAPRLGAAWSARMERPHACHMQGGHGHEWRTCSVAGGTRRCCSLACLPGQPLASHASGTGSDLESGSKQRDDVGPPE
jgi:hypothetical protein